MAARFWTVLRTYEPRSGNAIVRVMPACTAEFQLMTRLAGEFCPIDTPVPVTLTQLRRLRERLMASTGSSLNCRSVLNSRFEGKRSGRILGRDRIADSVPVLLPGSAE